MTDLDKIPRIAFRLCVSKDGGRQRPVFADIMDAVAAQESERTPHGDRYAIDVLWRNSMYADRWLLVGRLDRHSIPDIRPGQDFHEKIDPASIKGAPNAKVPA